MKPDVLLWVIGMVCLGIAIALLAKAVQADDDYFDQGYYEREGSEFYGKRPERRERDSGYRYFYAPNGAYQGYEDVPYGHVYDKQHKYRGTFYGD